MKTRQIAYGIGVMAFAWSACMGAAAAQGSGVQATAAQPRTSAWPALPRPAKDAPSVLLIMTDDVGYGASSTFGGPIPTPVFDALAKEGLRYTQFTTTGICSPSRAALLTGRNHNSVNVATVVDAATNFEGFTSDIPKSAATVARLLTDAGYATAMFGKGHVTPMWEVGPSGPFDRWPTGLGFGHFYGFLGGDTNQWAPALYSDTTPVEPPAADPDYILDKDLADKAIQWSRTQGAANPGKQQFVYYAPGTAHAPHHAPAEWIAKFRGKFDQGWDVEREEALARQKALGIVPRDTKLAARPQQIPAWNGLTAQQKRVYAREMEVYAAALAFADHEIGRVIEEMRKQSGGNLMIIYIQGDNGSSVEAGINGSLNEHALFNGINNSLDEIDAHLDELGGPTVSNHFSSGWAFAMNAPYPWFKQLPSHFGATRNGMVISWPGQIADPGGIRTQYHHIIDVAPTILDAAHVKLPESVDGVTQKPLDGVTMRYTFKDRKAPSTRRTQYYEIWDNMAIYHDGWVAATVPEIMPWSFGKEMYAPAHVEGRQWQLYDLNRDFSESTDLAARQPAKLEEMKRLFFEEAGRYNALPPHRFEGAQGAPRYNAGVTHFTFTGPVSRIAEDAAPHVAGRSFDLTAKVDLPGGDTSGTILALGGRFGGLSLYLNKGAPTFHYNGAQKYMATLAAPERLAPGKHDIVVRFDREQGPQAPATVKLMVDGRQAAQGSIARTIDFRFTLDESMDVGSDSGTPVSPDYATPNRFEGTIDQVDIDLR